MEVLVALAILGIAIVVILQLFSADLKGVSASQDYVAATMKTEERLRDLLDDDKLSEKAWTETTEDGYRFDIAITDAVKERTENLPVHLLEIQVTVHWSKGNKEKTQTMRTMKMLPKQV